MNKLALAACALGGVIVGVSGDATNCGKPGDHFNATNVTISPDPPVQGSPALLLAQGTVDEVITGGAASLTVYLNNFPLYNAAATTCGNTTITLPLGMGSIDIDGFQCPTTVGEQQNVTMSLTLPTGIPTGTYTVLLSGQDQGKANVFCMNGTFNE